MHELNGRGLWPLLIWKLQGFKNLCGESAEKNIKHIYTLGLTMYSLKSFVVTLLYPHDH